MSGDDSELPIHVDGADQEDAVEQAFQRPFEIQKMQERADELYRLKGVAQLKSSRFGNTKFMDENDTDPERILLNPLPLNPQVQGLPTELANRYLEDYFLQLLVRRDALAHEQERIKKAAFSDEAQRSEKRQRIILALEVIKLAWDQPEASASHTDMLVARYHEAIRGGRAQLVGTTVYAQTNNTTVNISNTTNITNMETNISFAQDAELTPKQTKEPSDVSAPEPQNASYQVDNESPRSRSTRRFIPPPERGNEIAILICTIGNDLIESLSREPTKTELINEICNRFNLSVLQDGAGKKYITLPGHEKITINALKHRYNQYLK